VGERPPQRRAAAREGGEPRLEVGRVAIPRLGEARRESGEARRESDRVRAHGPGRERPERRRERAALREGVAKLEQLSIAAVVRLVDERGSRP
jgi:hypothetical protein